MTTRTAKTYEIHDSEMHVIRHEDCHYREAAQGMIPRQHVANEGEIQRPNVNGRYSRVEHDPADTVYCDSCGFEIAAE